MKLLIFSAFVSLLVVATTLSAAAQEKSRNAPQLFRSPFRYVIVYSDAEKPGDKDDVSRTVVEVLLEPRAFTDVNLRKLFDLLQARFPDAHAMEVFVYTDLQDIETPEERDEPKISDAELETTAPNEKNNALLSSSGKKRTIMMFFANGRTKEFTF